MQQTIQQVPIKRPQAKTKKEVIRLVENLARCVAFTYGRRIMDFRDFKKTYAHSEHMDGLLNWYEGQLNESKFVIRELAQYDRELLAANIRAGRHYQRTREWKHADCFRLPSKRLY